ncbi:hypothetical protein E3P99_03493 [Wallemia hederae]|uniref:GRIP domain-containing protein n=1 Tax=Wallemia hederae TaxID=1540922 RepID=A0A4T0FF68_9BASI|nr:hypothetical protein E3P99_03493 [Wallemia hederae]
MADGSKGGESARQSEDSAGVEVNESREPQAPEESQASGASRASLDVNAAHGGSSAAALGEEGEGEKEANSTEASNSKEKEDGENGGEGVPEAVAVEAAVKEASSTVNTAESTSKAESTVSNSTSNNPSNPLQAQLQALQSDKTRLEAQYRGLLGKLSSMRDTLGEKLKEDAEELDRREAQISELMNEKADCVDRITNLERSVDEQEERNAQLSSEVSLLRTRLSSSEKASTDENTVLQHRIKDIELALERAKGEKEAWKLQADHEHLRLDETVDGNKELSEELLTTRKQLAGTKTELEEAERALRNVEGLLSEAQLANQKEFDEMRHQYETQIRQLKERNEDQRRQMADAKASLELFRQDAERAPELEQECKEKTLLIGKVRHEAVILNEHLTEALKRLKEYNTSDSVDRQLLSNILLQFVTTPRNDTKRFEMLSLLASILNWNQYEREQAGIIPKSTKYPIPSSPGSPSSSSGYFRRSSSRPRGGVAGGAPGVSDDNASFGQLFVEFLLKETGQKEGNASASATDQPWMSPRSDVVLPPSLSSPDLRVLPMTREDDERGGKEVEKDEKGTEKVPDQRG